MTNDKINQNVPENQEEIMQCISRLDVSFMAMKEKLAKLMQLMPYNRSHQLVRVKIEMDMLHTLFTRIAHHSDDELKQQTSEPLIIKEGKD